MIVRVVWDVNNRVCASTVTEMCVIAHSAQCPIYHSEYRWRAHTPIVYVATNIWSESGWLLWPAIDEEMKIFDCRNICSRTRSADCVVRPTFSTVDCDKVMSVCASHKMGTTDYLIQCTCVVRKWWRRTSKAIFTCDAGQNCRPSCHDWSQNNCAQNRPYYSYTPHWTLFAWRQNTLNK